MEPQVRQVPRRAPYRCTRLLILYLSTVKKELLASRNGYSIIDIAAGTENGDARTFNRDKCSTPRGRKSIRSPGRVELRAGRKRKPVVDRLRAENPPAEIIGPRYGRIYRRLARRDYRRAPHGIDNRERKRIHKFRDVARVRLYENYKAINYDRDKLSNRGAIIEREPR